MKRCLTVRVASAIVLGMWLSGPLAAQEQPLSQQTTSRPATAQPLNGGYRSSELYAGRWSGGGGLGMLWSTPDGTAFAMNGNVEYFLSDHVSVGPLVQVAFTGDMTQAGLSGQGKYWIDLPGTGGRGKLNLQSGVGFMHADFLRNDTSWLVPLGVGYEYALSSGQSLTAAFLLNFTNLHTGAGTGADVMPGFTVGLRF